ncbi:MAG TPA: hypothetical protein VMF63_09335, partial [Opitutaceae bacterium]|nr:hypothetical protein [Opitutaceae bacterium]
MGQAKREWERQMEEGWRSKQGFVCARCFKDYGIQKFIEANATANECSYCGREEGKPIAAELDEVMSF